MAREIHVSYIISHSYMSERHLTVDLLDSKKLAKKKTNCEFGSNEPSSLAISNAHSDNSFFFKRYIVTRKDNNTAIKCY